MLSPLAAVISLGVIWSVYWFVALEVVKDQSAAERLNWSRRGVTLSCDSESWGGYPFRFEYRCASPLLTADPHFQLKSSALQAVSLAYMPWHVILLLEGPTTARSSATSSLSVTHSAAKASVRISGKNVNRVSIELDDIVVRGRFELRHMEVHIRPEADNGIGIAASIDGLVGQSSQPPHLRIDSGTLNSRLSSDRQLQVDRIELSQDSIAYWGSGILHIDEGHRISGKLATETNNLDGLLGILEPHLLMTDSQKGNLRMVMGLLGQQAKIDLRALNGELFVGPFKVSDLLPLY